MSDLKPDLEEHVPKMYIKLTRDRQNTAGTKQNGGQDVSPREKAADLLG